MTAARVVRLGDTEYLVRLERAEDGTTRAFVDGPRGPRRFRVERLGEGLVLVDGRPVEATLTGGPGSELTLHAAGDAWRVEVLSELEAALRRAGRGGARGPSGHAVVRSPMPGRVLAVEVVEGQDVTAGAPLFILEAMKMENEIRAPRDGTVRDVRVRTGDTVEGGQELCGLSDGSLAGQGP